MNPHEKAAAGLRQRRLLRITLAGMSHRDCQEETSAALTNAEARQRLTGNKEEARVRRIADYWQVLNLVAGVAFALAMALLEIAKTVNAPAEQKAEGN